MLFFINAADTPLFTGTHFMSAHKTALRINRRRNP
jgi:hypothetical protein